MICQVLQLGIIRKKQKPRFSEEEGGNSEGRIRVGNLTIKPRKREERENKVNSGPDEDF